MTKRALLPLLLCTTLASQTAPKAATPPDQKAYNAARALTDPDAKLTALHQFLKDFPDSTRTGTAHALIFTTLLENHPERADEIDAEAKLTIKGDKDMAKWGAETRTARRLAAAGPSGVDLPLARKYADDALKNETEPKLTKAYLGFFKGEPAPKPAAVHAYYTSYRADALTASAYVAWREGNLPGANTQLDEAYTLAPLDNDVNALRGNIAYSQHHNAEALAALERAQVAGSISKPDRALLTRLYAEANPTGDLQATLDTRYRELFPLPFTPAPATPAATGHTALLELYTGSGCPPCVGGDLAVEALLSTRPRTEVVALAYDLHVPRPDPLTSPDTVARAAWDNIRHTPTYLLDGKELTSISGAPREGAEEIYTKLSKLVDGQAAKPSPVLLRLTATSGSTVSTQATVTLPEAAALISPTAPVEPPDPKAKKPEAKPATTTAPPAPRYILNLALVEDDIRYSGENGVRFHRMVVRALAKPSAVGFPLTPGKPVTLDATFDTAAIAAASRSYLDTYEKTNDRFGPIEFLGKPTDPEPAHLAVAAWVQDAETHRVLQSTFLPLTHSETTTK